MPVGTHGAVKGMTPHELRDLGATIILSNAYHLAQRPGVETVCALGGLHGLSALAIVGAAGSLVFRTWALRGSVRSTA